MITPQVTITDTFSPALIAAFAESRSRPDIGKAVNYVMARWVSFAIHKIGRADRALIKARLEGPPQRAKFQHGVVKRTPRGRESRNARYQFLKGSLAAYIVYATNYTGKIGSKKKGFRTVAARSGSANDFYALVGKYIAARQFSAGYMKSGLHPALAKFKPQGLGQSVSSFHRYSKHVPGFAKEAAPTQRLIDARADDWAAGILARYPNAFTDSLPEITALVEKLIADNLARRAAKAGLTVQGP